MSTVTIKPAPQRPQKRRVKGAKRPGSGKRPTTNAKITNSYGKPRDFSPLALTLQGKKTRRVNEYLRTLVDPERFPGVRYPDGYQRKTAMAQFIKNYNIPYADGNTPGEDAGSYYVVYRPSLVHPLWVYGVYANSVQPAWSLTAQTERFGIYPTTPGFLTIAQQDLQLYVESGTTYNLKMPMTLGTDWVNDPYLATDDQGKNYYGYTYAVGNANAANTIQIMIRTEGKNTTGDTLVLTATNGVTTADVATTMTAGTNDTTDWAATSATLDTLMVTSTTSGLANCCTRAAPIGFRIKATLAGVNHGLTIVGIYIKQKTTSCTKQIGLYPIDWDNQDKMVSLINRYRPVSASVWTSYQGSTLDNGGQHACLSFQGGEHPNTAGLYKYDVLADIPEGYQDKMKKGSYQIILPASTTDTQMRLPINSSEWTHPYAVMCGLVADTTQANPLRVRAVANLEFVSTDQSYTYLSTPPNQRDINEATFILFNAPTSMSNDGHWSQIWNWIKQSGKDVSSFAQNNAHWIVPLAKGLGSAAMMML